MGRFLKTVLSSSGFLIAGFLAGCAGASVYEWHYHPGDPDPVDFTAGAVLLALWVGVWLAGTLAAIWWFYGRRVAGAA